MDIVRNYTMPGGKTNEFQAKDYHLLSYDLVSNNLSLGNKRGVAEIT